MLSRLVIAFLARSKRLLLSWLQSSSAVVLEPKKINSVTVSIVSPSICHEVVGPDAMIFIFLMLSFKLVFFTFIKKLFNSSLLSAVRVVSSAYLRLLTTDLNIKHKTLKLLEDNKQQNLDGGVNVDDLLDTHQRHSLLKR